VIESDPSASVEVLKVVFPLLSVPVPSVVLPSLNVTMPVAVAGVTVAVKVTDVPNADGFADEAKVVVEFVLFTVCDNAEDVLPL
jgi:hypothetical protein